MKLANNYTHTAATIIAAFLVACFAIYLFKCLLKWCKCNTAAHTQSLPNIEGFDGAMLNQQARIKRLDAGVRTDGYNMEVMPDHNGVKVSFRGVPKQELPEGYAIKGYIMVLAQFDHNLRKVGHLNIRLSDEMETEKVDTNDSETAANNAGNNELDSAMGGSICNQENVCIYQFTHLNPRDPKTGNLFYYRLGVGIVYIDSEGQEHHSRLVPYGFGGGRKQEYFRLDIDREAQEQLLRRLEAIEGRNAISGGDSITGDSSDASKDAAEDSGMEAYMRMLRPHLGNYPDEFLMNKQQRDDASLAKYMQQSLAVGSLDVDVAIPDIVDDVEQ